MNPFEFAFSLVLVAAFMALCRYLLFGPQHHEFNPDGMTEQWRRDRFLDEQRRAR